MAFKNLKRISLNRRHRRVRKKVRGSTDRPRVAVFRSNMHLYAQVIDDMAARTLVAASTSEQALKDLPRGNNVAAATKLGEVLAKKAGEAGIKAVVFDRGGYRYHGRVKALAEALRKGGLEF
ncbi:MAG: 50S ribosomal protein L18 [Candidatus Omnitrophica bacterium]|nr:50S ribosomal protein L18 [Candidatus Omnitrophota bacterium]